MSHAIHIWTNEQMNDVATTLPLEVFTQRHFLAYFSTEFEFYWQKQQNRVLCHPLGVLKVTYTVHLWLVGKRVIDFLLVLIELFRQLSRLKRYERILVEIVVFERGESLLAKISGAGGSSTNDSWRLLTSEN